MKKIIQLLSLPILTLLITGCSLLNNSESETTTTVAETTVLESTTVAQVSTPEDTTTVAETTVADTEEESAATGEGVSFTIYVNGSQIATYTAEDAVGGSVLDAMNSISELSFTFDEDEGIVSEIEGVENDYASGETWVYLLNGEYAELGVVSQTLSQGDSIQWYFGTADELPVNIIPASE